MPIVTIQNFFTGKTFVIPAYQRDYAWQERNINDLFGDIEEALSVNGRHYLGTFILSQQNNTLPAEVVDGQQRLTTLTLLLDALIDALDENPQAQHFYRCTFIEDPIFRQAKFSMHGDNQKFFTDLIAAGKVAGREVPKPLTNGQDRLLHAYQWIRQKVIAIKASGKVSDWLQRISSMEVMELIEPDQGRAIRMFQSVNDRGVPLAKMDIVKSLLISYSNLYLDGELDASISDLFGHAFRSFNSIKRLASENGYEIRNINRDGFREDDVLRYHYLAFDGTALAGVTRRAGDFRATTETVLNVFLKPTLQDLRNDRTQLRTFIETYVKDLTGFFGALEELVQSTRTDLSAYLLWVVQDLSATLYPLVMRLHLMEWKNARATNESRTLIQLVELTDLRVFKFRSNPQATICNITQNLPRSSVKEVADAILDFCHQFMPNGRLNTELVDNDIYENPSLQRMLLKIEEIERKNVNNPQFTLEDLVALRRRRITVEHILPQNPENGFAVGMYGFNNGDDYRQYNHRLGNLVLLESDINSRCQNKAIEIKITQPDLYMESKLSSVISIAASCGRVNQASIGELLDKRSQTMANLIQEYWSIDP